MQNLTVVFCGNGCVTVDCSLLGAMFMLSSLRLLVSFDDTSYSIVRVQPSDLDATGKMPTGSEKH